MSRRDGYLPATKRVGPWRSGFCGLDLPTESHRRCHGSYVGRPCICECHQENTMPTTTAEPRGLTVYRDLEQRTEDWYKVRRGIVTASVVGSLLTPTLKVADNDTSRGITASLVAERITGVTEDTYVSADMWRGLEAEPIARGLYSTHYQEATEVGFMRLDADGWTLGYSPDGVVGDDGLIEVKAPRAKGHVLTILADEVPAYYMAQCQAGLLVSGRKWLDYVSFHGGLPLFVKRVHPDERWFEAISAACLKFEQDASALLADYELRADGMPKTERIDFEVMI